MTETKLVTVAKQFKLLEDDGVTYVDFYPGPQHMLLRHAEHWYVKLHLKGDTDKPPAPGTPEYGDYLREEYLKNQRALAADADVLEAARQETLRLQREGAERQANQSIQRDAKHAVKRVREKLIAR